MGAFGLWELLVVGGVVFIAAVVVRLIFQSVRDSREVLQQAIEGNQPEIATGLIRQQWSHTSLAGFTCVGVGLALLAGLAWQPRELAGLLLFAGILLCAGTPMALFGYFQTRADGRPGAVAWVVPAIASIASAGVVFGVASRAHFGALPSAKEAREFHRTRREWLDHGLAGLSIDGHRVEPCLTGNSYATQGCGTPRHDGIRFETTKPGYLNVYYIPDTDQYLVLGRARVSPAGVTIEDDLISVQEALGRGGGGTN